MPGNCLLVGVTDDPEIKILDLDYGVVTKTISNPSKDDSYHCFQRLIGHPSYVLIKDSQALTLMDTNTLTATKLVDSCYDNNYISKNCMF